MRRYIVSTFIFIMPSVMYASGCTEIISDKNNFFMVNTCKQTIGPIHFCWESEESDCSCFKGTDCGAGPLKPGRRELISGPGRKAETNWKSSYCVHQEWVAGDCRPSRLTPGGQAGKNGLEALLEQQAIAERQAGEAMQSASRRRASQVGNEFTKRQQDEEQIDRKWRESRARSQAEFSQAIGAIGAAAAARQNSRATSRQPATSAYSTNQSYEEYMANLNRQKELEKRRIEALRAQNQMNANRRSGYSPDYNYDGMLSPSCQAPCGVK